MGYIARASESNINCVIAHRVVRNELLLRLEGLVLLQLGVVLPERLFLQFPRLPEIRLQIVVVLVLLLGPLGRWNYRIISVADIRHILDRQLRHDGGLRVIVVLMDVIVRSLGLLGMCGRLVLLGRGRNIVPEIRGRSISGRVDVVHVVRIVAWP